MKGAMIPCSPVECHKGNWKKVLSDSFTDPLTLLEYLELTPSQMGLGDSQKLFKLRAPKPYVDRIKRGDPNDPLLRQIWPADQEALHAPGYSSDPLEEASANQIPGLLHKYSSRVLTIAAASCAINCRYCFRRHFDYAGQAYGSDSWQSWFDYIEAHPEINEVILSGGEPLLMSDSQLERLCEKLGASHQIKRLRIHTRMPLVIPSRITERLLQLASSAHLKWILVWHINHPNEIDQSVVNAAHYLSSAGVLQLNQSVLLHQVNDSAPTLVELSETLFDAGILPYYLHLLDPVLGTHHFHVDDQDASLLHKTIQAQLPGFLVPKLVREQADEPAKTIIAN